MIPTGLLPVRPYVLQKLVMGKPQVTCHYDDISHSGDAGKLFNVHKIVCFAE